MIKGDIKPNCGVCGHLKHKIKKRVICGNCSRVASLAFYHKTKHFKVIDTDKKRKSNLKWRHTIRESGFTNQQICKIKHRYKITEFELLNYLTTQKNKCGICDNVFNNNILVDHNHDTGKIRGLLCRNCNFAIGLFKDNIKTLKNAIKYITNDTKV